MGTRGGAGWVRQLRWKTKIGEKNLEIRWNSGGCGNRNGDSGATRTGSRRHRPVWNRRFNSFVGNATTDGGSSIASATKFTSITAKVESDSGDYDLVRLSKVRPRGHDLTSRGVQNVMTDYSFNPSQGTVTPLWKFTSGGITYAFDATTLTAVFDQADDTWNIAGKATP